LTGQGGPINASGEAEEEEELSPQEKRRLKEEAKQKAAKEAERARIAKEEEDKVALRADLGSMSDSKARDAQFFANLKAQNETKRKGSLASMTPEEREAAAKKEEEDKQVEQKRTQQMNRSMRTFSKAQSITGAAGGRGRGRGRGNRASSAAKNKEARKTASRPMMSIMSASVEEVESSSLVLSDEPVTESAAL
jgi:hypothetical protein